MLAGTSAFFSAVAAAGITDWDNRTDAQCTVLLAALDRAGISGTAPANAAIPKAASCDALVQDVRPVLRGPQSAERTAILSAMVALGITSIDPTNPKHCAEIAAAAGR